MRWLGEKRLRLFSGQMGLTLIEMVVALGLLGAIGTGLLVAFNTNARAARTLDEQVVAANLVSAYLETIRNTTYATAYPSAGENITIPSQYSVAINLQYSDNGTGWVSTYTNQTLQKITILVSRQGRPVLSVCTFKMKRPST
ncbi:MAG: type II secretion system protein [Chloroflexi bacterium]|nr:type II secretion system protein [Chloroflexota bacterium]